MKFYDNIQKCLNKKNINVAVGTIYDLMALWKQWYRGNVNDFHNRTIKLADGKSAEEVVYTMNMAKKVCEDFAKLLWSEKTKIELGSKKNTKKMWEILDSKKNSFSVNFPKFIEKTFALGTGALVEYLDNDEPVIDYIDGDIVLPYKYTNSYIYGMLTVSRSREDREEKTIYISRLTYHEYDGINYTRYNELYESENESELGEEKEFSTRYPGVINPYVVQTQTPYFQIFYPNLANNFDTGSPLGISIFANAIDNLKALDIKYDSFVREFELGKKRIMVDPTSLKARTNVDENGNVNYVKYFDSNDKVYVAVDGMEGQPAKEIDFNLRTQEHIDAINSELNWLSTNVGLGKNYYKFDGQSVKTATEVVSENSDTFRSKVSHQTVLNDVIYDLVKSICELAGIKADLINIISDDSIIEDTNMEREKDRKEVSMGIMTKAEYRAKWYGESLEDATKNLPQEADIIE